VNVSTTADGETVRIRVTGELDALTVSGLVPVFEDLLRGHAQRWVLDLSQLRMIDSSGVGAIIYAYRKLRERGGALTIEGATAQPLSILSLMRLDRAFAQPASPTTPGG
jgi:anti-sigma B factor antagonist